MREPRHKVTRVLVDRRQAPGGAGERSGKPVRFIIRDAYVSDVNTTGVFHVGLSLPPFGFYLSFLLGTFVDL